MKKYALFISVFLVIVLILRFGVGSEKHWKKYYLNNSYNGVIEKALFDPTRKGQAVIILKNSNQKFFIGNDSILKIIKPGDLIIKKPGTTEHLLVKGKDSIFFYPVFLYDKNYIK